MSITTNVSFQLHSSDKGYTLTIGFPIFGTQTIIPFTQNQTLEKGVTFDLYSENGKVGQEHPLSFFKNQDVKCLKEAVKFPLPKLEGKVQTLFVLDLKDQNGNYGDLESIRQS